MPTPIAPLRPRGWRRPSAGSQLLTLAPDPVVASQTLTETLNVTTPAAARSRASCRPGAPVRQPLQSRAAHGGGTCIVASITASAMLRAGAVEPRHHAERRIRAGLDAHGGHRGHRQWPLIIVESRVADERQARDDERTVLLNPFTIRMRTPWRNLRQLHIAGEREPVRLGLRRLWQPLRRGPEQQQLHECPGHCAVPDAASVSPVIHRPTTRRTSL